MTLPLADAAFLRDNRAGSEALLTNGLGGFALLPASGIPARRYHAWLVAATRPPIGRITALHSCLPTLRIEHADAPRLLDLWRFRFSGDHVGPGAPDCLTSFTLTPEHAMLWTGLDAGSGLTWSIRLALAPGRNAAEVRIEIDLPAGAPAAQLEVRPLLKLSDFHNLLREHDGANFEISAADASVTARRDDNALHLTAPGTSFNPQADWWRSFHYATDAARAQDHTEDLFCPGFFALRSPAAANPRRISFSLTAEVPSASAPAADAAIAAPAPRPAAAPGNPVERALFHAASQFVVLRRTGASTDFSSIIAGYPWFSDWGRDTCIALPGLLLATGRHAEARRTLLAFANLRRNGLIPNCFDDGSGAPQYNTVDAPLWFIHAVCEYLRITGDSHGFTDGILPACTDIIDHYTRGTDFHIRADPADGLITAGDATTQLTWMDAKRDGVVFTPRHGKAVEINALWHAALLSLAAAIERTLPNRARDYRDRASRVAESFFRAFWNPRTQCLHDVITPTAHGWTPDPSIRPNQIFAVSLPHSPLPRANRRLVVETVRAHLLTPHGLRTLSPSDPRYRPRYEGTLFERDAAYHNGTVWPWLLGPFCEAELRLADFSDESRRAVRGLLTPLATWLTTPPAPGEAPRPLAQLPEVLDGDDTPRLPRRADGCPAQAWSVAEVLRVWMLAAPEPRT